MEEKKKLIIIGIGETANLAYEYFSYDSDYEIKGFAVEEGFFNEKSFKNLPVIDLNDIEMIYPCGDYFVFVAMGSGKLSYLRTRIYNIMKSKGYCCASYISSKAFVWRNVEIGENCFILENNTLQPFVKIHNNVTLWSGNHIGHQSIIKDNCFLTSHVVVSGFCEIGENTFMGVNSCVADKVKVAKDNFIGMGTVINKSTIENGLYTGNPAVLSKISARNFCRVKE